MYDLVFHKEVAGDISDAITYYANISPGLTSRFEKELFAKFRQIQHYPLHYGFLDIKRKNYFRRVMLRTFPYKIVYAFEENVIVVYGVIHGKRSPRHILKRF